MTNFRTLVVPDSLYNLLSNLPSSLLVKRSPLFLRFYWYAMSLVAQPSAYANHAAEKFGAKLAQKANEHGSSFDTSERTDSINHTICLYTLKSD
jgi:hypothetical protein